MGIPSIHLTRMFHMRLPVLLATGLVFVLAVSGVLFGFGVLPVNASSQAFLDGQSEALRPEYQREINRLARSPRYTIAATLDPQTGELHGEVLLTYTNRSFSLLPDLVFRLYPNAATIYGGGSLTVTQVTQNNQPLALELAEDPTILRVPLQRSLLPGQAATVQIDFQAQVPEASAQGYGIFNRARGVVALAGWYPILAVYENGWQTPEVPIVGDALMAETSLYEVWLTLPEGYQLAATGTLLDQITSEDQVTWQVVSGPAREFAAAVSDRFETSEAEYDGITLHLHLLPAEAAANQADEALQMMTQAFTVYEQIFGPYPYNDFNLVEAPITIGGYEFSGLVMVDDEVRNKGSRGQYEYLVVHEIAHQWWYGLVGTPTVEEPWLDEGHASYAYVLYLEGIGKAASAEAQLNRWHSDYTQAGAGLPPVNSSAADFTGWAPYSTAVYDQGALFLHQLRQEMGDEAFFELLRQYQQERRYGWASTSSYLEMAEALAGRELDTLYAGWFALPYTAPPK